MQGAGFCWGGILGQPRSTGRYQFGVSQGSCLSPCRWIPSHKCHTQNKEGGLLRAGGPVAWAFLHSASPFPWRSLLAALLWRTVSLFAVAGVSITLYILYWHLVLVLLFVKSACISVCGSSLLFPVPLLCWGGVIG